MLRFWEKQLRPKSCPKCEEASSINEKTWLKEYVYERDKLLNENKGEISKSKIIKVPGHFQKIYRKNSKGKIIKTKIEIPFCVYKSGIK
jgi:hypothetical protein